MKKETNPEAERADSPDITYVCKLTGYYVFIIA